MVPVGRRWEASHCLVTRTCEEFYVEVTWHEPEMVADSGATWAQVPRNQGRNSGKRRYCYSAKSSSLSFLATMYSCTVRQLLNQMRKVGTD